MHGMYVCMYVCMYVYVCMYMQELASSSCILTLLVLGTFMLVTFNILSQMEYRLFGGVCRKYLGI